MQDETVHERVNRLFLRTGLSQRDFAVATGDRLSEAWIQKFLREHQPKFPTRSQLEPLVDALNTKLDPPTSLTYLMEPMGVVPIEDLRARDWGPLVDIDNTIPEDVRQTIRRLAETARRYRDTGEDEPPEPSGKPR